MNMQVGSRPASDGCNGDDDPASTVIGSAFPSDQDAVIL